MTIKHVRTDRETSSVFSYKAQEQKDTFLCGRVGVRRRSETLTLPFNLPTETLSKALISLIKPEPVDDSLRPTVSQTTPRTLIQGDRQSSLLITLSCPIQVAH